LAFRPLPLLREIKLGLWEQKSWGDILRMNQANYVNFNKRPDLWQVEGAETFAEVRDRMLEAVRLMARKNPGMTVAATSHGAALRTLLGTLQGMSLEEIGKTGHADNTAVSLIEVDGDAIRVVFRDDNSHVPSEFSTFRRQSWHKDDAATEPGLWFHVVREEKHSRDVEAMLGEETAGLISMEAMGDTLCVTRYEIVPHLRGQRYGVQLLGQAVQYARALGLDTVHILCPEHLRPYFLKYGYPCGGECSDYVDLDYRLLIRPIP